MVTGRHGLRRHYGNPTISRMCSSLLQGEMAKTMRKMFTFLCLYNSASFIFDLLSVLLFLVVQRCFL